ncbi:response regulator transcription factor [Paenibacillus athensensis]|uniref:LuxR family transcriptional regulator n=1 Tax=Paenibacillus athensensis TaxID=1967502 RepID=A0A4Y8Q365_9BACL|nr:response regulator transcription factor [Paenibacillus athensensis]MCD1258642.1 response regulator transcription factor [Paenibacillus athensensis]
MIKVVLVDGQRLVSEGIKFILERDEEIQVVGFAANVEDTLQLCGEHEPDVLILDVHMPGGDGIEITAQVHRKFPATQVIVLTGCRDLDMVVKAMNSGASGYMLKNINPDELVMTVKSAALGLSVMHKDVLIDFTRNVPTQEVAAALDKPALDISFTEREINIIKHVVDGKENREIAQSLFLSVGTVKNTISTILKKLNLRDRIELVVFAVRNNLL